MAIDSQHSGHRIVLAVAIAAGMLGSQGVLARPYPYADAFHAGGNRLQHAILTAASAKREIGGTDAMTVADVMTFAEVTAGPPSGPLVAADAWTQYWQLSLPRAMRALFADPSDPNVWWQRHPPQQNPVVPTPAATPAAPPAALPPEQRAAPSSGIDPLPLPGDAVTPPMPIVTAIPATSSVPEPGMACLLSLMFAAMPRFLRRRRAH